MNHLRSAALAVVSVSLLVAAAGCNSTSDITEEAAPKTEIVRGVEPKTFSTPATVCPATDPEWHQVQASRVAKYLFGGNDPWDWSTDPATGSPVGESKEFGPAGEAMPNIGDPDCDAAAECWRAVHDSLYPSCGDAAKEGEKIDERFDPKTGRWMRNGVICPSPSSTLWGGGAAKACGLPAELFKLQTAGSFPYDLGKCVEQLDRCWSPGVSGFMYIVDPQKHILGFDPEPADLTSPLSGSTGAAASARWASTWVPTAAVLWPDYWEYGSVAAGTPCSTYGLPTGARTWKAIVASGSLRKCL